MLRLVNLPQTLTNKKGQRTTLTRHALFVPTYLVFIFKLSNFNAAMLSTSQSLNSVLARGDLRRVHHIALNVKDMQASRHFYGNILGLHELTGHEIPETLAKLVVSGKVANFVTPDGTVVDLFWEPELTPPDPDPERTFTRAYHLAFDIAPNLFDRAVQVLRENEIAIAHGPVTRPTGKGVYFYDPDGFMVEIRCDPT